MSEQKFYKVLKDRITGKGSRIFTEGDIFPASLAVGDMAAAAKAGIVKELTDSRQAGTSENDKLKQENEALKQENEAIKARVKELEKDNARK